jgi:ribosomal protein L11 methyltransferase
MHEQAPFDLIIANILAKPLQQMALDIVAHTASGGTVILSGLLPHQRTPIIATFRLQGLHLEYSHIRDGWLVLVFGRG